MRPRTQEGKFTPSQHAFALQTKISATQKGASSGSYSEISLYTGFQGALMNQHGTSVIVRDPEILSGEPVFAGTRVPFQALLDYLEAGDTLDDFLKQFPGVTRQAAIAALEENGYDNPTRETQKRRTANPASKA